MGRVTTIAIVDDDPSVRNGASGLLKSRGYFTTSFSSAEDFLNSGHLSDISCVITDVKMPGMSGIELQRRLISQGLRTPIIFMTAFPEESIKVQALSAEPPGLHTKPFRDE